MPKKPGELAIQELLRWSEILFSKPPDAGTPEKADAGTPDAPSAGTPDAGTPEKADAGTGGKVDPNADSTPLCLQALEFLDECEQTNWSSKECSEMKTGCKGYDPTVALTGPDSEDINCKISVSGKDVQQVVLSNCQKAINPAPGEDPCAPNTGGDQSIDIHRYTVHGIGLSGQNPCDNPEATCDDTQGAGTTVSVVKLWTSPSKEKECEMSKKIDPNVPCLPSNNTVNIGNPVNPPGPAPGPKLEGSISESSNAGSIGGGSNNPDTTSGQGQPVGGQTGSGGSSSDTPDKPEEEVNTG